MIPDTLTPRALGAVVVAALGLSVALSVGAPAVTADDAASGAATQQDGTFDAPIQRGDTFDAPAQQDGIPDCTRCHSGVKARGLTPKLCGQCHTNRFQKWRASGHAESLSTGSKRSRITGQDRCARCHVERNIKQRTDITFQTKSIELKGIYEPVTCEACHSPPRLGWFAHFGKGNDSIPPNGVGPHDKLDANVSKPRIVCPACHSNAVVLTLANRSKINPHSTGLNGTVRVNGSSPDARTRTATPTTTPATIPGFTPVVAVLAFLLAIAAIGPRC
ncbi:MAG: multiheme c-type cytochrome [Halodesulfurarchaeum sp.]